MLLVVSLGYGIVRPTLGASMYKCIGISVAHFITGVIYGSSALNSAKLDPVYALFIAIPISFTLSLFYTFIMNALAETMRHLKERNQGEKIRMYRKLQIILGTSFLMLLGVLVTNAVNASYKNDAGWIDSQWVHGPNIEMAMDDTRWDDEYHILYCI